MTKLDRWINRHKDIADNINFSRECGEYCLSSGMLTKYIRIGEDIALVLSGFACESEGCGKTTDLTVHHLVGKDNRKYLDEVKYIVQRHYFRNLAILCKECHIKLHKMPDESIKCISQRRIKKITDKLKMCGG